MTIRKVMRHCDCGHIECVGVHPMPKVAAYHAAHGPCSKCLTVHRPRIFWFSVEEVSTAIERAASRLPQECA